MRRETNLRATRLALAALLAVALCAGTAVAAETQSAAPPSGGWFTAVAVGDPGAEDMTVSATGPRGMEGEDLEFSVFFDESEGEVYINGQSVGSYEPANRHSVTAEYFMLEGIWYANIVVRDLDQEQTVGSKTGHEMSQKPALITVTAEDVISLDVQ